MTNWAEITSFIMSGIGIKAINDSIEAFLRLIRKDSYIEAIAHEPFRSGITHLEVAKRRVNTKKKTMEIERAKDLFIKAYNIEEGLKKDSEESIYRKAQIQGCVGVCWIMLKEKDLAKEAYESAYRLAKDAKYRLENPTIASNLIGTAVIGGIFTGITAVVLLTPATLLLYPTYLAIGGVGLGMAIKDKFKTEEEKEAEKEAQLAEQKKMEEESKKMHAKSLEGQIENFSKDMQKALVAFDA